MTKNAQRLSQLTSTFGPGAMIDLPTRSVVVAGLEFWDMPPTSFTTISEPRLTARRRKTDLGGAGKVFEDFVEAGETELSRRRCFNTQATNHWIVANDRDAVG